MLSISPDRLIKEELEYELTIRGVKAVGTVKELIASLREVLLLEKEGEVFTIKS